MNVGDIVLYCDKFQADLSESPNISPAIVTKVNKGVGWSGTDVCDLFVFFPNGDFTKQAVSAGNAQSPGTYFPKP